MFTNLDANRRAAMPGRRRSMAERRRDIKKAAEMYLKGRNMQEIAEALEVDVSTVSRDLAALHNIWLESALLSYDEIKRKELARIDNLEATYWEAWERSKQERKTREIKEFTGLTRNGRGGNSGTETLERTEEAIGDPRYLAGIQWCIDRRIAIFGLQAPAKHQIQQAIEVIITHEGSDTGNAPELLPPPSKHYLSSGPLQDHSDGAEDGQNDPSGNSAM